MDSKDRTTYEIRIRELEEALRCERLRTSSLEEMINIAEEELKTSIRKSPVPISTKADLAYQVLLSAGSFSPYEGGGGELSLVCRPEI